MSIMLCYQLQRRRRRTESGSAAFRSGSEEAVPQGIDDLAEEGAMARNFLGTCSMRTRRPGNADRLNGCGGDGVAPRHVGDEAESDLPSTGEFDIDLRKQLSVEQRAMLDPLRPIDTVASAEGVETMFRARMARPSQDQRVDHPGHAHRTPAAAAELMIEEAEVEARIMGNQGRIADEFEQLLGLVGEARLVA